MKDLSCGGMRGRENNRERGKEGERERKEGGWEREGGTRIYGDAYFDFCQGLQSPTGPSPPVTAALGGRGLLREWSCIVTCYTCVVRRSRHYTFYIWKDILGRHPAVRYIFVPLYVYCTWALQQGLSEGGAPALWQLGFAFCTAAVLVPSPLLELR